MDTYLSCVMVATERVHLALLGVFTSIQLHFCSRVRVQAIHVRCVLQHMVSCIAWSL